MLFPYEYLGFRLFTGHLGKSFKWTIENIKEGLDAFFKTHKRYPSATEIDKYQLLPSSRQIQRRFGGLRKLRESLNFLPADVDLTRGKVRADTAKEALKRGNHFELVIYDLLVSKFGEIFVHAQKPFNNNKNRMDFLVYCKDYKFGVDVFFADDFHSFMGCINLKQKTYQNVNFDIIFLSANPSINQEDINTYVGDKRNKLSEHILIMTTGRFEEYIEKLQPNRLA